MTQLHLFIQPMTISYLTYLDNCPAHQSKLSHRAPSTDETETVIQHRSIPSPAVPDRLPETHLTQLGLHVICRVYKSSPYRGPPLGCCKAIRTLHHLTAPCCTQVSPVHPASHLSSRITVSVFTAHQTSREPPTFSIILLHFNFLIPPPVCSNALPPNNRHLRAKHSPNLFSCRVLHLPTLPYLGRLQHSTSSSACLIHPQYPYGTSTSTPTCSYRSCSLWISAIFRNLSPLVIAQLSSHVPRGMNGDTLSIGATTGASKPSFATLSSSRAIPFTTAPGATKHAMSAQAFAPQAQPLRLPVTSQSNFSTLSMASARPYDRDITNMPVGTPFASSVPSAVSSALIRRLPRDTSEDTLRVMMTFSKDLNNIELLPPDQDDRGFRSALLKFRTQAGAHEAKNMLDGKPNIAGDANMVVEVSEGSPINGGRRYANDVPVPVAPSTSASSTASSNSSGRQASRFNGMFQPLDTVSSPMNGYYENHLPSAEGGPYATMYNSQTPIGNHLRPGVDSGKALINNDTADDDETSQLLDVLHSKDSVGYGDSSMVSQRRSTAPHIPVSRMANLSLNTNEDMASSMPPYGQAGMTAFGQHAANMSPTMQFNQNYRSHQFPPVNPADQNPPCNTLYVGNLPANTSEEELKAMFSKQRGYKRLCFRTKQNGPMCFVEFEDVSFATKALNELYGHPLHNSVKGGIRLSFSKNPLGVRSSQNPNQSGVGPMAGMNGMMSGTANGYAAATGPPPGISGPPGFGTRMGYSSASASPSIASNPYLSSQYSGTSSNLWNGPNAMAAGGPSRGSSSYHAQMYGA